MVRPVDSIRTLVVGGHGSAGKTTLVDQLLLKAGAVTGHPSVDDGTSICDFDDEEKHHRHSVEAAVTHLDHAGKRFYVIDTPGYPELLGQTIGALRGADNALVVIDGHSGIKVNTRKVWSEAGKAGLGRLLCITKIDDHGCDVAKLMGTIKEVFGPQCVLLTVPTVAGEVANGVANVLTATGMSLAAGLDPTALREQAIESIIEVDDAVMEKYFEGEVPTAQQLAELLPRAVAAGTVTPVFCVSAKHGLGLTELLDGLTAATLSPADVPREAKVNGGDVVPVVSDASAPLVAQVFRTRIDPFVQKLSFVRIFQGTLTKDSQVNLSGEKRTMKVGPLLCMQADKSEPTDSAGPGEIVALAKAEMLHTGTTLGDAVMPAIVFPNPMVGLAVSPKSRGDEGKLSTALHKLAEEDPTVHVDHDAETKETVITGMSELHLKLIQERLKRRDHVEVETHEPKIPYRETVQQNAEGFYRHKKQTGGAGQFAEVHLRVSPLPEGVDIQTYATKERFPQLKSVHYHPSANFVWLDSVVGGAIPGNFMPAIEKGFLERISTGIIAGCKVQNLCVEVFFGKDHPVDSNETAFKIAAGRALAQVFRDAKPVLLEPIVNLHISIPAEYVGDVSSDLPGRRGQMLGMDSAGGGITTVDAKAPLSEVLTYARTLSSMTGGQGAYTMEFSHYEPVPPNVQHDVLANAKVKAEED